MPRDKNNPQVEDGFTRIANDLLEAILAFGFTQREQSVLLAVIRKTYGYHKKTDDMSASQISALCKVPRQHVTTTLLSLANRNVITKSQGQFGSIIGVQKNHRKWIGHNMAKGSLASPDSGQGCPDSGQGSEDGQKTGNSSSDNPKNASHAASLLDSASPKLGHPSPESGHVQNWVNASPDLGQVDSPKLGHTKENLPKENQQKKDMSGKPDAVEVLQYLNLKANRNYKPVKAHIDLILGRLSESSVEECKAVIDFKVRKWLSDSNMSGYLRPKTLFNATNFANYVGELPPVSTQAALLPADDPDAWRKGQFLGVK